RVAETWTGNHDTFADLWSSGVFLIRGNLLINYALPLLCLTGLLLARRAVPALYWPMLATLVLFPVVYYVCHTTARYRHPIDPLIVVFSSYSMVQLVRAVRGKLAGFQPKSRAEELRVA